MDLEAEVRRVVLQIAGDDRIRLPGERDLHEDAIVIVLHPAGPGGNVHELLTTLWCYLDNGRSLEATARELFVHPNTVRYRLKRVTDVIGWDATGAREALILQAALIVGSINEPERSRSSR